MASEGALILVAVAMLVASLGIGFAIRPISLPPVVIREREPEVTWEVARA